METEKENIYMLVPCAICGGFQSMETYVSNSQVVQFGFSVGCNWSPILWHFCTRAQLQVKQMPYVKRLFSPPPHTAASQSYRQLVHGALFPSCHHKVTATAQCLLQATIRALAFSGTLADRGSPLPQRTVYDCLDVVYLVFLVPVKTQPQINWLLCADLHNYKCTNHQSWV